MRGINLIVVHCAATHADQDIGVAEIRSWHMAPPKNWNDVGYHWVIRRDGTLEKGRDEETVGAHAVGYNSHSIGICLVGGIDANDKMKADFNFHRSQMATLERLLTTLTLRFPAAEVCGHRDLPGVQKACPAFNVKAWWYGSTKGAIA